MEGLLSTRREQIAMAMMGSSVPVLMYVQVCKQVVKAKLSRVKEQQGQVQATEQDDDVSSDEENLTNPMTEEELGSEINSNGQLDFVQTLRSKMLGRNIRASGRTIVDEQGGMMLADSAEIVEEDAEMKATEIRAQWGVN